MRSVVARSHCGDRLAILVGPLSWLNHSLCSGVVFTTGASCLLKKKFPKMGMLFAAAGFADRCEILIRYCSPQGCAGWSDAVEQLPWLDDVSTDDEAIDER